MMSLLRNLDLKNLKMNEDDILAKANQGMNIIFLQLKLEEIQSWGNSKAGRNSKMQAIQKWRQFKNGGNSEMEAIRSWKQFGKYCLG